MKAQFNALECNGEVLTQLDVYFSGVRTFSEAKTFPAKTFPKGTQQVIADALRYYAALLGDTPFRLEWSETRAPDANGIRYNHVVAESPLGLFSIEWKGWKAHPGYELYLNGEWLQGTSGDLDDSKQYAFEYCLKLGAQLRGEPVTPTEFFTGTPTLPEETKVATTVFPVHPDTERLDFMETHIVIAGPGQGLRNAVDVARQMFEQGADKGEVAYTFGAANSAYRGGSGGGA